MSRRLYQFAISGHCHRVALMLALLGLPYESVEVDLFKHAQREPGFLALNPIGQVPVLDDEGQVLSDSNASLADVALYTYTAHAPEGGIDLQPYPRLRAWLARVEALPGFVPMAAAA